MCPSDRVTVARQDLKHPLLYPIGQTNTTGLVFCISQTGKQGLISFEQLVFLNAGGLGEHKESYENSNFRKMQQEATGHGEGMGRKVGRVTSVCGKDSSFSRTMVEKQAVRWENNHTH